MPDHAPEIASAFRPLRRALIARRLQRLDPVLRLELALIGALAGGYAAWRARLPLDQLARTGGAGAAAAAEALAAALAASALLGGMLAGADHAGRLRRTPPGPEWLALPVPAEAIVGQLAWESGLRARWVLPLALGLLAAGAGLTPGWSLAILAAAFLAILPLAGRAGAAVAWWLAVWRLPRAAVGRPALHPLLRRLRARVTLATDLAAGEM